MDGNREAAADNNVANLALGALLLCFPLGIDDLFGLPAAESAFSERGDLLGHDDRMTARYLLYRATGEEGHIAEAWRLLRHLRDHAPERYRRTVLESVPLHREIREAAGV